MMKQIITAVVFILIGLFVFDTAYADEKTAEQEPWEKAAFKVGGFISSTNTSFRLGSGAGVDIDVEKLLNLDSTNTVYRLGGLWRFTDNRKHRMDLSWFSLRRSGENTLDQDVEIPQREGKDLTTIPAGIKVESYFDLDIYQLAYSYSFLQDDRIDLAAQLGLYIMPISFGIKATGLVDEKGDANFTAPLPTVGFRMDIALAPKWFFRSGTQMFYLEYQQFKGSILAAQGAVEYEPWKHLGIGLGVDSFQMRAEAKGEDYPGFDFSGNMEFSYVGLQLYARVFF
jgi:hypothetical protein